MTTLKLSPQTVEYDGPMSGFFAAMREAKKFLSGHRKWEAMRSELQLMRMKVWALEARNCALRSQIDAMLRKQQQEPVTRQDRM